MYVYNIFTLVSEEHRMKYYRSTGNRNENTQLRLLSVRYCYWFVCNWLVSVHKLILQSVPWYIGFVSTSLKSSKLQWDTRLTGKMKVFLFPRIRSQAWLLRIIHEREQRKWIMRMLNILNEFSGQVLIVYWIWTHGISFSISIHIPKS